MPPTLPLKGYLALGWWPCGLVLIVVRRLAFHSGRKASVFVLDGFRLVRQDWLKLIDEEFKLGDFLCHSTTKNAKGLVPALSV